MKKDIAIIRYNAGNIRSVLFALERLGYNGIVTDHADRIRSASHVIFPGVGAANSAMPYLRERGLDELILSLRQPFLGICLGMQLMCRHSEEGDTPCLGVFDIDVRRFPAADLAGNQLKVPHMGWNALEQTRSPLFEDLNEGSHTYFVHSYYAGLSNETIATTVHGILFSSALHHGNFWGVQFHPEKSATIGETILRNFISFT